MLLPLGTRGCRELPFLVIAVAGDLLLPHTIDFLGWGKYLLIDFLSFPLSCHDDCTSSYDLILEIYLLILGIVYQIDCLSAAITLLMVSQGEYSIQHLALHRLASFRQIAPSIRSKYWNRAGSIVFG